MNKAEKLNHTWPIQARQRA